MKKPTFNSVLKKLELTVKEADKLVEAFEDEEDYDSYKSWDAFHLYKQLNVLLDAYSDRVGKKSK